VKKSESSLVYMTVKTSCITTVSQNLEARVETLQSDRNLLTGGDWNKALAVQVRENNTEKRRDLAQQITALLDMCKLTDVCRRVQPDRTHLRNGGKQTSNTKSKLDRMYL
jgi:hypothetical protein